MSCCLAPIAVCCGCYETRRRNTQGPLWFSCLHSGPLTQSHPGTCRKSSSYRCAWGSCHLLRSRVGQVSKMGERGEGKIKIGDRFEGSKQRKPYSVPMHSCPLGTFPRTHSVGCYLIPITLGDKAGHIQGEDHSLNIS